MKPCGRMAGIVENESISSLWHPGGWVRLCNRYAVGALLGAIRGLRSFLAPPPATIVLSLRDKEAVVARQKARAMSATASLRGLTLITPRTDGCDLFHRRPTESRGNPHEIRSAMPMGWDVHSFCQLVALKAAWIQGSSRKSYGMVVD